jgi:hypothetical protein
VVQSLQCLPDSFSYSPSSHILPLLWFPISVPVRPPNNSLCPTRFDVVTVSMPNASHPIFLTHLVCLPYSALREAD